MKKIETFDGNELHKIPVPHKVAGPKCVFQGVSPTGTDISVPLDNVLLSRHILFLGGIGTGKTNAFFQIMKQLRRTLTRQFPHLKNMRSAGTRRF